MINEDLGSFKELEQVYIKTTQPIEVNGYHFEEGEVICSFDKVQISGLNEFKTIIAARGGFDNRGLVFWETTKEIRVTFSQGVFSNTQFGILNNAKVLKFGENDLLLITCTEEVESQQDGVLTLKHVPYDQFFAYLKDTGEKIYVGRHYDTLHVDPRYSYKDIIVRYRYNYENNATIINIGQQCLQGFLELEGKTRVKDDMSGLIKTGIIKIPRLKIMSGLSIRLGSQANPVVGSFEGVGVPVGSRHNSYVMEFDFLSNDIDSDM